MKKRQKDFDKVTLRVGKSLPKKKNETNTEIKKRKLQMPSQKLVKKSALSCEDYVKSICQGSVRDDDLKDLKNMILKQRTTFIRFLPEILNKMTKIILDNNLTKSLRDNALKVLQTILEHTDNSKISCFFPLFINVISCAVTNSNDDIKGTSLELIDSLLKTHPDLICCSVITFNELLTLLSGQLKKAPTIRTRQTDYNIADAVSGKIVKILDRLNTFLKVILKNEANKEVDKEDEQEVYWDCKSPLYLELYAGGGLKPLDIEKLCSFNSNSGSSDFKDPVKMEGLLKEFIPLCSGIFIEFSEDSSSASDALVSNDTIRKLSVLFEFLSNFGEWIKALPDSKVGDYFARVFSKEMLKHLVKFPFSSRDTAINLKKQDKRLPSVHLNLAICYLYSTFILDTNYCTGMLKDQVFDYLISVQNMTEEIQNATIPMLLKITKNYLQLTDIATVSEYVDKILFGLCEYFGKNDLPNQKLLASFLIKVSLEPEYNSIIESKAMKVWFSRLLAYLVRVTSKGSVDKRLLNDIKKIANRKYRHFLDSLEEMQVSEIIKLLKHSNEDVKDTANFLICNMEKIPSKLYEELSDIILTDSNFPFRITARLIRLLAYRFNKESANAVDRVDYIQFLLNLALDVSSLQNDNFANSCPPEFLKAWQPCNKYAVHTFLPSLQWKKHAELFEVCCSSLFKFPPSTVNRITSMIILDLLKDVTNLPVHSVIAVLRLNDKIKPEKSKAQLYRCHIQDLTFSCFFFISVYTTLPIEDDWYYENVTELMNSLDISRAVAIKTVQQIEYDTHNIEEGIVAHYFLRICRFFISRNLLQEEDRQKMLKILENMKKNCKEENLEQQTLFIKLVNCFSYYHQ